MYAMLNNGAISEILNRDLLNFFWNPYPIE